MVYLKILETVDIFDKVQMRTLYLLKKNILKSILRHV